MWLSFALLILVATLFVIFADEVVNVVKKYWKIPWFKLLAPLLVASYLFLEFELLITWIFNRIKVILFNIIGALTSLLPKTNWALITTELLLIFLLTLMPVVIVDQWLHYRHKTKRLPHRFYISLIIWVFVAILFVSGVEFN